ncbi:MAG TPA: carboxypeptidase-like regulatory domain-containing protein [Tepidisphaeraceae bacterium]
MTNRSSVGDHVKATLDFSRHRMLISRRVEAIVATVAALLVGLPGALNPFAPPTAHAAGQQSSANPATRPTAGSLNTYHVAGRVLTAEGTPAANSLIEIPRPGGEPYTTRTGADGKFLLEGKAEHAILDSVLASSADRMLQSFVYFRRDFADKNTRVDDLELTLKPVRILSASVQDQNGQPVQGAWVAACSNYRTVGQATTDAKGQATLRLPADAVLMHTLAKKDGVGFDYHIFWGKDENHTDPYRLEPDFKGPLNFVLNGVKKVTVVTVDDDERPIAGVRVDPWLYQKPRKGTLINLSGVIELGQLSDAQGKTTFEVPSDLERQTNFWTRMDGYCAPDRAIYDPAKLTPEIRTQLLRMIPLKGRVEDAEGHPVPDAIVRISGEGYRMDGFRADTTSDSAGSFNIDVNPDLYYMIGAEKDVRVSPPHTVLIERIPPTSPIYLTLRPTMSVRARVVSGPGNTPVPDASVTFYQRDEESYYKLPPDKQFPGGTVGRKGIAPILAHSLKTDAQGIAEFRALIPGSYSFYTYANSAQQSAHFKLHDSKSYTITIFDRPGGRREEPQEIADADKGIQLDIHAEPAAVNNKMVRGRVVMRDNPSTVVPDIKISARSVGGLFSRDDSVSNKQGSFTVRQDQSEEYLYGTSLDGKLRGIAKVLPSDSVVNLMVGPTALARGHLVDPQGNALGGRTIQWGVEITNLNKTFSNNFGGDVQTDATGHFQIDGLVPGYEYKFSVVTGIGDDGRARSWYPVAKGKATSTEAVDLGEVAARNQPGAR